MFTRYPNLRKNRHTLSVVLGFSFFKETGSLCSLFKKTITKKEIIIMLIKIKNVFYPYKTLIYLRKYRNINCSLDGFKNRQSLIYIV